ncbi:MAG: 2-deoxy-D-gluconate 3-dehydrogenase [Rhodospirillaceae bacterium]|nr:2-deoxy-D-gluconate 3-dehydrogenase [Rhodospirillaceae bacterium]
MSSFTDLTGKVALVTGASQGLGKRFAVTLAKNGAKVALAARQLSKLHELRQELNSLGADSFVVEMDVLNTSSIKDGVAEVEKELGSPDILVNNAGLAVNKLFLDVSEEDYDLVLGTNLKGSFFCAQVVARKMIQRGGGSIINISSVLGSRPIGTLTTYCASKGGLNQLTATMALELARHEIRVNAIAPGYIETPMNREFFKSLAGKTLISSVPQRRLGQVQDLDGALLLLASDASKFMTGTVITVDGGFAIR